MMEKFRELSHNIFFKIFLGFVGLSFIMFGVSGFILGSKGSWVAKVGGQTISYDKFLQEWQQNKEAIQRSNSSKEVLQYLESTQFKQDVLGRMVTRELIKSLQEEFKLYPNRDLILKEIAESPTLQTKNGKFDRALYQNFLRSNGINEKQHVDSLMDEVVGNLIIQSFVVSPGSNYSLAKDLYQYRFQTRNADLITISAKNVGEISEPNDFELNGFFDKHKDRFALPELRQVSFLVFDSSDLKREIKVADEEIEKEYQENKSEYQIPESANFYHILFTDEASAKEFYKSLKEKNVDGKTANADQFMDLAVAKGKDKSAILLKQITKKELPSEIAADAFRLDKDQYSEVLKSKLGFHVFYLLEKTPVADIPLAKVKDQIKSKLLSNKQASQERDSLKAVEDEILATNSIDKVAEKLKVKVNRSLPKFSVNGLDVKQRPLDEVKNLDDFVQNSFSVEKGKVSRIFFSESNKKYYVIFVESVDQGRQRSLDEVRVLVTDMWIADKKQQKLFELAAEVSKQINRGVDAASLVSKYGLKIEKNKQFPRFYMIDVGGKKMPYANKLLTDIFSVGINKATAPQISGNGELIVAVVRSVRDPQENEAAVKVIAADMENSFRSDILNGFNQYVQKKFPVEINQKLIQSTSEQNSGQQ
ncbi:MAG: ppiD [Rickettsiaceae bacterium]|jgi:peptidyl-prolyl cis-trans isomerase D|nr:ppiD [Rickettsiaceae bacterium]